MVMAPLRILIGFQRREKKLLMFLSNLEVIFPKNYAMAIFDDRLYFPNIETKYSTDLLGKDRIDLK